MEVELLHLQKVKGWYRYRVRVPEDLKGVISQKVLSKTLKTKSLANAKVLVKAYDYHLERIFTLARAGMLSEADIRQLVNDFMTKTLMEFERDRANGCGVPIREDLEDPDNVDDEGYGMHYEGCKVTVDNCREALVLNKLEYVESEADELLQEKNLTIDKGSIDYKLLCRYLLRGLIETYSVEMERIQGQYRPIREGIPVNSSKNNRTEKQEPVKTLSQVIDEFIKFKSAKWVPKTAKEYKHSLSLALEVLTDKDIKSYCFDDFLEYRETLKLLPPNHTKLKEFKGKTIQQIVSIVKNKGGTGLAPKTLTKNVQYLSSLFKFAVKRLYVPINHAEGLAVKTKKKHQKARKPYTIEDLKALLNAPMYKDNAYGGRPERFWLPLMALFSGARLNELASLYVKDIIKVSVADSEVDGIWCFNIDDDTEDKSVKNENSIRVVPIHPVLIDIGFLEYVGSIKHERLFPKLEHSKDNGYGNAFGKWYGTFNRKHITDDKGKVFHSFRHTVANSLKQLGVNFKLIEEILGHEDSSMSTGHYSNPFNVVTKLEALEKLEYSAMFKGLRYPSSSL